MSKKIGIMGGTFDPIHIGHLVTAEEAFFQFGLDEVIFMPSGIPAHKEAHSLVDAKMRYQMTELATNDNPHFSISSYEIDKAGISYTVETMAAIHETDPAADIFFITGADAVLEILTWKDPWRICDYGFLIAATRPGYDLSRMNDLLQSDSRLTDLNERLFIVSVPALAISSTDIRNRISQGRPIRYLVPESVHKFIMANELYRK